jgi:hypothetical protein
VTRRTREVSKRLLGDFIPTVFGQARKITLSIYVTTNNKVSPYTTDLKETEGTETRDLD